MTAGWFLDDEPSRRFPVYCRGNVGEIVPNVATPLSATVTTDAFRIAFTELFRESRAFSEEELAEPSATGGLFGGYLYFNLSFARAFASRIPGMRVADIDQQMFGGSGQAPPFRRGPGDRSLRNAANAGVGVMRMVVGRKAPDLDGQRADVEAWARSIPAAPTDAEVVALVSGFAERFASYLRSLLEASMGSALPSTMIQKLAAKAVREEPGLLVKAMSGLGGIETTQPALELWRMGRLVASSPALTAVFDRGVPGVRTRLDAAVDQDDVRAFLDAFDAFLAAHGHRGPREVEIASDTWATAPEKALAVVERVRLTPTANDPDVAGVRLAEERADARRRLRGRVLWPIRPVVDRLLDAGARGTARREQAKGTLVRGVAGLRTALFGVADRLVADGTIPDRTQLFMVTVGEMEAFLADPASMTDELARRRTQYEALDERMPPFAFEGAVPDPTTWPLRTSRSPEETRRAESRAPVTLTGIGVSSGVARGPARIITDPGDPRGLEPGEVLVAPLTDPAWTPLFLAAVAVVVDVGALQSHAAIVARELGIPAVVSVEGASRTLADGELLEVDGDRGVVVVVRG